MKKLGFDNDKYIRIQSEHIKERIEKFKGKLYLELGGKLFDDHHASRVLPGFQPDSKLRMLQQLSDKAEIVIVISAIDIEKNKVRQDLGITYDEDVLRLRKEFQNRGFLVDSVVITHYNGQNSADMYRKRLERLGIRAYYPGPGSGKMAVCLSQLYNENKRGVNAGYAKFETFPVWNLPLNHPVNIAYEAATADLNDINMIDPFHFDAYEKVAINYNRDVEIFPVLNTLFEGIYGECPYKSPTDMGVNMVGFCISDDEVCQEASKQEIIRRYYTALNKLANGGVNEAEVNKLSLLMKQAKITTDFRKTTLAAKARKEEAGVPCSAIELPDGRIITAASSVLLGTASSLILNAVKSLAGIDHDLKLIPQYLIEPVQKTKIEYLGGNNPRLHTDEVLVALSILSQTDENCKKALEQLPKLRGCQAHFTIMLGEVDRKIFKKLGVGITCDPIKKEKK